MYKHYRNSHAFDDMNGQVAYWLGFLYTDGCVYDTGHLEFKLSDREPIEAFAKFIEYNGPIIDVVENKNSKIYTSNLINIKDEIMVEQLKRLGCMPRKTTTNSFPTLEQLPEEYHRQFIRGVFDGDGSVFKSGRKIGIDITGTEQFLMGLRDVLEHNQILPKEPIYIYPSHAKNETIKRLNFTKKESIIKFFHYLYDDVQDFYLQRKKSKYEQLMMWKYGEI